jgi:hypothetical protein
MRCIDTEFVRLVISALCEMDVLCGRGVRMLSSVTRQARRFVCKQDVSVHTNTYTWHVVSGLHQATAAAAGNKRNTHNCKHWAHGCTYPV